MEQIIIHGSPKREWYINEFLVPSLYQQGFKQEQINIYMDTNHLGNLHATLDCFQNTPTTAWHLQDDVLIGSNFAERIQTFKEEIVCGFASHFDREPPGLVTPDKMWFSFPCIKIPNKIAHEFVEWCNPETVTNSRYRNYMRQNKFDDTLFKSYVIEHYPEMEILNLDPNLVNHVDWLLGGSTCNPKRYKIHKKVLAKFWDEPELLDAIEKVLSKRAESLEA